MSGIKQTLENSTPEENGLYFSPYAAIVTAVGNGTEGKLYQIKVECPSLYSEPYDKWLNPIGMVSGDYIGIFAMPRVGDRVYLLCQGNDIEYPLWIAGSWEGKNLIEGAKVDSFIIQTKKKFRIELCDEDDFLKVQSPTNQEFAFLPNEKIYIKNSTQEIVFDKQNNTVSVKQGTQELMFSTASGGVVKLKNGNVEIELGASQIKIANSGDTLKSLLSDMIDLLVASPIATMLGPQVFINSAAWTTFKSRVAAIFS